MNTNTILPRTTFIGAQHMLDELLHLTLPTADKYPVYNVVKHTDASYVVEIAVAGFALSDLNIEVNNKVLTITGERKSRRDQSLYLHKGISARKFTKSFRLMGTAEVTDAKLENGLLVINIEIKEPEASKSTTIKIGE